MTALDCGVRIPVFARLRRGAAVSARSALCVGPARRRAAELLSLHPRVALYVGPDEALHATADMSWVEIHAPPLIGVYTSRGQLLRLDGDVDAFLSEA